MNTKQLVLAVLLTFTLNTFLQAEDIWFKEVKGLEARLLLIEKPKPNGPRWLVPHLELRNVRDTASSMNELEIDVSEKHLKLELVDGQGKVLPVNFGVRSGPGPALSKVILPYQSSIRISLEGKGWGISNGHAAIMPLDSEIFHLTEAENGNCYLRATLTGMNGKPSWRIWQGKIDVPLLPIQWSAQRP